MENSTPCYFFLDINRERYKKYFRIHNKLICRFKVESIFVRHRLSNVPFKLSLRVVQFFIVIAKCPVGETSFRRTASSTNRPVGEMSRRRNVPSANCPVVKMSRRRTVLSANCPVGKISCQRTFCRRTVPRRSVRVPSTAASALLDGKQL